MNEDTGELAVRHEKDFVIALGGFALEIAGGTLVTHERIPAPQLNFVQAIDVSPHRQAAFFERALDHYFQRALRPTFRLPFPIPDHADRSLRHFGFRPREHPHVLLGAPAGSAPPPGDLAARVARPDELDVVVDFWSSDREREEFRRSLDVLWTHPNASERLSPVLAFRESRPVAALLVYRRQAVAGIHAVSTQPDYRGQGAATALVLTALQVPEVKTAQDTFISADHPRIVQRLGKLGFHEIQTFVEYRLPRDAQLSFPGMGPPGPPRWRPPPPPS